MASIMRGAEPFYFKGNSIGCLLIHGLTGTPKEVRGLGERLAADGYTTLGVQLAGHCTCPTDLNATRWPDWYADVIKGYRQLRHECAQVFAIGYSMGGILSFLLVSWEMLDGIVALSTPGHLDDWRISVLRPFRPLIPYWPKLKSDMVDKEMDAQRLHYDCIPTICVLSLLELLKLMRQRLRHVATPTLFINARRDIIAPPANARLIYERIPTTDKHMLTLERSGHCVCEDIEREMVFAQVREFVAAHQQK